MKLVNLGCGNKYHENWMNFDFKSNNEEVQEFDLNKKLPFKDNTIDVVYSSHVLEHFSKDKAPVFLDECYRILRPEGIIRIVVPDLEQLMKNYIKFFDEAKEGNKDSYEKYKWTMIELFDQMVRNYSGGEMLNYWKQNPMPQEEFVIKRLGSEVTNALKSIRNNSKKDFSNENINLEAEEIGKFRTSGEIHQWMYDELSLGKLLEYAGFKDIKVMQSNESNIHNFNSYLLDIEKDGTTRKPDSLFMEAIK